MDDSLVNIDEALSDSFSLTADESFEDVNAIVQQWKQSAEVFSPSSGNNDDKFLNTRTFTRPKRRVYAKCSPHLFATPTATAASNGTPQPSIRTGDNSHGVRMQIGGLVSSAGGHQAMQRSFLGDVSPPSSMCGTSFTSAAALADLPGMPGSLITSSDFSGMNDFMLDSGGSAAARRASASGDFDELFGAIKAQVFDDISALNGSFDSDVANGDSATLEADGAGDNDTFHQLLVHGGGGGGCPDAEPADRTATQQQLDTTYANEDASANRTMLVLDAGQPLNVTVDAVPSVLLQPSQAVDVTVALCAADETCVLAAAADAGGGSMPGERAASPVWDQPLSGSFRLDQIQLETDSTFEMMGGHGVHRAAVDVPSAVPVDRDHGLQSTPIKPTHPIHGNPYRMLDDINVVHISPISHATQQTPSPAMPPPVATAPSPANKFNTYVRPKVRAHLETATFVPTTAAHTDAHVDDDLPSPADFADVAANAGAQRDNDERQSLTNFEEFEKSLSLCQNDHDFDDMLNGLAASRSQHQRNAADAQMRQSLDHIKKRHSLLNLEKQLEDQQQRRIAAAAAAAGAVVDSSATDSNRLLSGHPTLLAKRAAPLMASSSSSSTSSTTSVLNTSANSVGELRLLQRGRVIDDVRTTMDRSAGSGGGGYTLTPSDSKENVQHNCDSNRYAQPGAQAAADAAGVNSAGSAMADSEHQPHGNVVLQMKQRSIPNNRDRFKTIRISKPATDQPDVVPHITDSFDDDSSTNVGGGGGHGPAAVLLTAEDNRADDPLATAPSIASVPRRRALTRPSQPGSFAMRRDASLTIDRNGGTNGGPQTAALRVVPAAAMLGVKAKSIQNLVDRSVEKSTDETNARGQKELSEPMSKIKSGLSTQRSCLARPSGLTRPSSGLYSFGLRRQQIDSDTESGRMSPTNSVSSGSSKGSLSRADIASDDALKIETSDPIVPAAAQQQPYKSSSQLPSHLPAPKRSGIQPPTASGAFASAANRKRSGLPRPMSMAHR